jgi:DNA-binding CsgD family transcriptional regulator
MAFSLGARAAAVRETIAELCESPPSAVDLIEAVATRVRSVVPYDTGNWMITDPATLLPTSIFTVDATPAQQRAFTELELGYDDDVNRFDSLAQAAQPVASLSGATGGDLAASRRYREIHRRFGLGDELRAVARSSHATWGMGCINRADDVAAFSPEEVRFVTAIAAHLGAGLRRALARRPPNPQPLSALGVLIVDEQLNIEASTGQAERWLDTLEPFADGLPTPIAMVAMRAQINGSSASIQRPARLRLPVPGGWLLVHADTLKVAGSSAGRVAVVLEPADRAELMPLLVALHGLTERERDVAELLVAGLGTDEIASRLHISRHTLRDYIKAIFAKVGVGSRPELTAALAPESSAA